MIIILIVVVGKFVFYIKLKDIVKFDGKLFSIGEVIFNISFDMFVWLFVNKDSWYIMGIFMEKFILINFIIIF